jgi:hypothetical protein
MQNFPLAIFLLPGIALILVFLFYFILKNKSFDKPAFKKLSVIILVWALLLNFIWEMAQMPLFRGMVFNIENILFCALASVADAIMTLLLYFGFAFIYDKPSWVKNMTPSRIISLIIVGGIGAILAEIRHTSLGNWAYTESMPLLPFVNVGLSPVLQFMVLPAIIYYLSFRSLRFL